MANPGVSDDEVRRTATFVSDFMPDDWPFEVIRFDLQTPLWLRQAVRLTDNEENVSALLTWAFLDDPLHRQFLGGAERLLHPPEWNEGLHPWIIHGFHYSRLPPAALRRRVKELVEKFGTLHWLWDDGEQVRICRAEKDSRRVVRIPLEAADG